MVGPPLGAQVSLMGLPHPHLEQGANVVDRTLTPRGLND